MVIINNIEIRGIRCEWIVFRYKVGCFVVCFGLLKWLSMVLLKLVEVRDV